MSRILKDSKKHVNQASSSQTSRDTPKTSAGAIKLIKDMPPTNSATENTPNVHIDPAIPAGPSSNRENAENLSSYNPQSNTSVSSPINGNDSLEIIADTQEPELEVCDSEDSPIRAPSKRKLHDLSLNSTFNSPEKCFQPKKFSTDRKDHQKKRRSNDSEHEQQNISLVQIQNNNDNSFIPYQSAASPAAAKATSSSGISITSRIPSQSVSVQRPLLTQLLNPSSCITNLSNMASGSVRPALVQQPAFHQPTLHLGANIDLSQLGQIITIPAQNNLLPYQHHPQLIIPAGFQGTILFQPTIYMHSKSSEDLANNLAGFRKIVPKKKP